VPLNYPTLRPDLSTDELYELYSKEAVKSIGQRQSFIDQNLAFNRRLAAGSPQELQRQLGGQLDQIRGTLNNTFSSISRRLGPSGGGQIERENRNAVAGANTQLRQTLAGGQLQGVANLSSLLNNFRPTQATQLPTPIEQHGTINLGPILGQAAGNFAGAFQGGGGFGGGAAAQPQYSPPPPQYPVYQPVPYQ
jgi:hypothetical protein